MTYYEFWCRSCGKHSYEESISMHKCPVDGEYLELSATVEGEPHLRGVMGMEIPYTNRKILDKKSR